MMHYYHNKIKYLYFPNLNLDFIFVTYSKINHMKLPKMKSTQFILLLLFSFQLSAQIPDSLNIDLPWQSVSLDDCEDTLGEGPKTENENVSIFLSSDIIEKNGQGDCLNRTRTWLILDLLGFESYTYVQVGLPNSGNPLICQEDLILTYDQLPYTLNKENVVLNLDEDLEYSFSYSDVNDNERVIETGERSNYEIFMYEHTTHKVCKLNVYLTQCEEDVVLNFPESADIEFNTEPYIELTPEMLGVEVVNPCGSFTTRIKVANLNTNLMPSSSVGKIVPVRVEVTFSDGDKYIKIIQVIVEGVKPDAIPMFIEDKSFVAGETIELEVWSDEILGLVAWQLQLQFANTEILSVDKSELFTEIPFNIFDDGNTTRALWFPANGFPINVESDATWFTLVVKPDFDGSTFDIFQTEQDPWSAIAIDDEDYIFEYEAEFTFNIAPRDVLGIEDEFNFNIVDVFPNPSTENISITGMSDSNSPSRVEVFNLEGKLLIQEVFTIHSSIYALDISQLPTGMYILKTQNGNNLSAHKISKF